MFRRTVLTVGCLAALLVPSRSHAQAPGELDASFTAASTDGNLFALSLETINDALFIFAGGDRFAEALLDATGTIVPATTFGGADFGGPGRIIYTAVPELLGNGANPPKLLIGGLFGRGATQIANKQPAQNIVRLLTDGSLDPNFNPGTGANNYVTAILPLSVQFDGGIVIGGTFTQFNRENHSRIVRTDNGGTVVPDSVFSTKLTFNDTILSLASQGNPDPAGPQGQILAAGLFTSVNGRTHSYLARINADGTVDDSFAPVFNNQVRVVISQADGKILAGGDFGVVNGSTVKHLVRLNYDGSVDSSFNAQVTTPPAGIDSPVAVNTITPAVGGGYYIGGNFAQINGVTRNFLGRVRADGTVDAFDPGKLVTNAVQQVAVDPTPNLVYVSETRSKQIGKTFPPNLIRLYGGPVDTDPVTSVQGISTVAISATKPAATEAGLHRGKFALTRSGGDLTQPMTVYLKLKGTGAGRVNTDYSMPATQVQPSGDYYVATFAANQTEMKIQVRPTGTVFADASETVTLRVKPDQSGAANAKYTVSTASRVATVTLRNE